MLKDLARPLPAKSQQPPGDCHKKLMAAAVLWRKVQASFQLKAEQGGNLIMRSMARICAQTAKSLEQAAAEINGRCPCCLKSNDKKRDKLPYWKQ